MIGINIQPSLESARFGAQLNEENGISFDARKLRTQHNTEGYRDGIAVGKTESIQGGFDVGFELGANVGMEAGRILGLLEGVAAALKENGLYSAQTDQLLLNAIYELSTDSIFAKEYWAADGSWKYIVHGSGDHGEVVVDNVASGHPIIVKWNKIVCEELKRWGLDQKLGILDNNTQPSSPPEVEVISRQAVNW
ncbi:hypothetical protein GGR54DRAFT_128700 [Hypoxylon sp. NC1633]|nr:hypothetical protein GGR54DRAFT_128700 [Hypoxylon sp. NC1633]